MFNYKKIFTFFTFLFIFTLCLIQINQNNAKAVYYNGKENYLGYGIDVATAGNISQDAVKTTARIFNSLFLNSQSVTTLSARTGNYDMRNGFSSSAYFEDFSFQTNFYLGFEAQKGPFSLGESMNFKSANNNSYSEYNSMYFNKTSVVESIGGYGLDQCTSNPNLYSSHLTSSFLQDLNNLPNTYYFWNFDAYAKYADFFDTYGTHIICKAYYGGKVDIYKTVQSLTKNFDSSTQLELSNYFGVEGPYNKILNGEIQEDYSIRHHMGWDYSDYSESISIHYSGGEYLPYSTNINVLSDNINNWRQTINWNNADLIDFGQDSLYPLYKLIEPLNYTKSKTMEKAYNSYLNSHYNTALSNIKTNSPYQSNVVDVFDGTNTISDKGRWQSDSLNIYFIDLNIDPIASMQDGYNVAEITLTLRMWEEYDGWECLYIYDGDSTSATLLSSIEDYEYGPGKRDTEKRTVTFHFPDIPLNQFSHNYFTFRARAHGYMDDIWHYDDAHIQVVFRNKS